MDTDNGDVAADDVLPEEEWLSERIKLERKLYGPPASRLHRMDLLRPRNWTTLQQAFEVERYAVLIVQLLFVAEIVLLFAAT
jgi:hypothetical protein